MPWTLILWIYAGAWAKGDSMALTTVPGFASQADCQKAGQTAVDWTQGTTKAAKFQCVQLPAGHP